MNVSKNLINIVFAACIVVLSKPAAAQILSVNAYLEELKLPEGFLPSLEQCQPYHAERPERRKDVVVNNLYTIDGVEDGLCVLHITGINNSSVEIHQDCNLPLDVAKTYAHTLQRFVDKKYSPLRDEHFIEKDADYQAALKIMTDTKYCHFLRKEIDNTREIRKNLMACQPAEQTEAAAGVKFTRRIIGLDNNLCKISFSVEKRAEEDHILLKSIPPAKVSDFPEDFYLAYDCALSEKLTKYYLRILEAEVVPEEDDFDFDAVWHLSPDEEMRFMSDFCDSRFQK